MSAGRFIVGSVGVKVRPYTEDFADELRIKLDKEEKRLDALEVDVEPDAEGLRRDANQSISKVQASLKDLEVALGLQAEGLKKDVAKAKRLIASIDDRTVRVNTMVDKAGLRDLKAQVEAWDRLNDATKDHVEAADEVVKAQREMQEAVQALHDWVNRPINWTSALLDPTEGNKRREFDQRIQDAIDNLNRWQVKVEETEQVLADLGKNGTVDLAVKVDERTLDHARETLAAFSEHIEEKRVIDFVVEPDLKSVKAAQDRIDRMLKGQDARVFRVTSDPEDLRRLRNQLEDLRKEYDGETIEFEPGLSAENLRLVALRLGTLARDRWVTFKPVMDSKAFKSVQTSLAALSGYRMVESTFRNIWDFVKNLDKNMPKIAGIVLAVQSLGAAALSSSSNLLGLAGSIVQIVGAGLALPGIAGGFAVGIGTMVTALRDFHSAVPEVRDDLTDLREMISERFWAVAAQPMRRAWDGIFVPFSEGIKGTADALGWWFREMSLAAERNIGRSMPQMFKNLNDSIMLSAGSADDVTRAIEILGKRGSDYLPRLAQWGNDIAESFADWLYRKDQSGEFEEMIETALDQMHELGRVVRHTGGILRDMFHAAQDAGGSSLKTLADRLERIRDVTSDESFQHGMSDAFAAAHDMMHRIAVESGPRVEAFFRNLVNLLRDGLPDAGEAVGHLLGGMAEALATERFSQGFHDMLRGIREGVESMDDMWTPVGDGLGALMEIVGNLAREFGPVLGEALRLASEAAERLEPHLSALSRVLSDRLLGMMERFGPLVISIAEAFLQLLEPLAQCPLLLETLILAFGAWKVGTTLTTVAKVVGQFREWAGVLRGLPGLLKGVGSQATILAGQLGGGGAGGKGGGGIAAVGGKAGLAAAIGMVVSAIGAWEQNTKSTRMENAIGGIDLEALVEDLKDVTDECWKSQGAAEDLARVLTGEESGDWSNSLIGLIDGSGVGLEDLGRQMGYLAEDARKAQYGVGGFLNNIAHYSDAPEDLAKATATYDEALKMLVQRGNLGAAKQIQEELTGALVEAGFTADEAAAMFPSYEQALSDSAAEAERLAEETAKAAAEELGMGEDARVAAEHVKYYEQALADVNGVTPELIGSLKNVATSFIDMNKALTNENGESRGLDSWLTELENQASEMRNWLDNMAVIAKIGNEEVIQALQNLGPEGAGVVQELADGLRENGGKVTDEFNRLAEIASVGAGNVIGNASGEFNNLAAAVDSSFLLAELSIATGMDRMRLAAELGGSEIPSAAAQAIIDNLSHIEGGREQMAAALAGDPAALAALGNESGLALIQGVIDSVNAGVEPVRTAAAALALTPVEAFASSTPLWATAGSASVGEYVRAIESEGAAPVKNAVTNLTGAGVAAATAAAPMWVSPGATAGASFGKGLADTQGDNVKIARDLSAYVAGGLGTLPGQAATEGAEGGVSFAQGLSQQQQQAYQAASTLVKRMSDGWTYVAETAKKSGLAAGNGFAGGLGKGQKPVVDASAGLRKAALGGVQSLYAPMYSAGMYAGSGFAGGVRAYSSAAYAAGAALGRAASNGARAALDIHSPSRVMYGIGEYTALGMADGLIDAQDRVESAAERLAEAAARGASARNLKVDSEVAVNEARGEAGMYEGATVYQTVYNPVERSSAQELNAGLQTLSVLV